MKVLVTGGTGFVGPKVVHALRARSHDVRALVRKPERERTLSAWGCELAAGDMTDPDSLHLAVEGCDAVVHLVSIIRGSREDLGRVMVRGTRDLVSASREAGIGRFVLMSALLFRVTPTDPQVFAVTIAVLVGAGLAASTLPALRASSVDPLDALRHG